MRVQTGYTIGRAVARVMGCKEVYHIGCLLKLAHYQLVSECVLHILVLNIESTH
jgi:hypothetical protein